MMIYDYPPNDPLSVQIDKIMPNLVMQGYLEIYLGRVASDFVASFI